MNDSIFSSYNHNRGTAESRAKHDQVRNQLAKKNAKRTIVTFPNGEEKIFDSAMKASRELGGSMKLVSHWIKNGSPKTGKWKGYSARFED